MAIAYICVAGQHAANANAYYRRFSSEPIRTGPLMELSSRVSVAPPSFAELLRQIVSHRATKVLIVGHGTTEGLTMPLVAGRRAQASTAGLGTLTQANRSDAEKARDLGLTESQVRTLKDRLAEVQALGLTRVELRACNFGQTPAAALSPLARALNAQTVGAPICYDAYASFNPGTPSTDETRWRNWSVNQADPRYTRYFNNGQPVPSFPPQSGGRVGICVTQCGGGVSSRMMADSWEAVRQWVAAMFPPPRPAYQQGPFPAHFLFTLSRAIFPCEREYRNSLAEVTLQAANAPPRATGDPLDNLDI